MLSNIEKNYFVLIKFSGDTPIIKRIKESAMGVKNVLEDISNKNMQLVFTSDSGDVFGYFIRTKLPAGVIRASLDGETEKVGTSVLKTEDSVVVFEVGDDFHGRGFSKAWTWLQHR